MHLALYQNGRFERALEKAITFSCHNWSNAEGDTISTEAYAYTAKILFEAGASDIYEDLVLHFQGTIPDKSKEGWPIKLLDEKIRFTWQNGKYQTNQAIPD